MRLTCARSSWKTGSLSWNKWVKVAFLRGSVSSQSGIFSGAESGLYIVLKKWKARTNITKLGQTVKPQNPTKDRDENLTALPRKREAILRKGIKD